MSRRPLALDDYGISRELYNELRWFCRSYQRKRAAALSIEGGFNNLRHDGMPRGSGIKDPTGTSGDRAMRIRADVEAIEQAAIEADSGIYREILRNVTEGVRFEELAVPCGGQYFYKARRRFFWCLARRLGKL